ncbi:MAG: hypothetical protein E7293_07195 [Lachnospiraceae bacterium]|nr:hypothetical protein [Lachnospiraceae bacterium]
MLKVGLYEKDITPPLGCIIPGYFNARFADDVKDRLYAKAVVFSDGESTVGLVVMDALLLSAEIHDAICMRVQEYTGIPASNVNICCTHTHTGIPYAVDHTNLYPDEEYISMLKRLAADCVILAYKRMTDCVVEYGTEIAGEWSFQRTYRMKDGRMQTAPDNHDPDILCRDGQADHQVAVLVAKNAEGKPLGAMINYACHLDIVKGNAYSGDFPSIISYELKKLYGQDFVSMFVNGTCGNLNHVDATKDYPPSDHYIKMGKALAQTAVQAMANARKLQDKQVACVKKQLIFPTRPFDPRELEEARHIVATVKEIPGATLAIGGSDPEQVALVRSKDLLLMYDRMTSETKVWIQVMKVGDCLLYLLPGEPFVQFGIKIKEKSPVCKNLVIELSGGGCGYFPLKELYVPTVFESQRQSSPYLPGTGEQMVEEILRLADQLM